MEEGKWKGTGRQRPVPAGPCAGGSPVGPDTLELGTVAHFKDVETGFAKSGDSRHSWHPAAVWGTKAEFCGSQRERSP